ncbi:SCO6880 family protein [Jiangella alkaliphila]|uniref:Type VII ESX secretion system translocon, EccE n=1 Tax=Jiangella alkaliphila TaxID=419479 RepID=A0A1H2L857_9ACTN|nr:SCO6880 family protein [Jiangella alkaliphila]SDU77193.1 hypothetical protein SAMN04488563_5452 [Jiangella alkaliphila]
MTGQTPDSGAGPAPVSFSRLSRRGVLLGLSLPRLLAVAVSVATMVTALYLGGGTLLALATPVWVGGLVLAWVPAGGRTLVEWIPVTGRWVWRASAGQLVYRRRVVRPRPAGTLALPGDAASLREYVDPTTGTAMIHDPHARTLTAVCQIEHPSFVLLDAAEQQRRVNAWGRVLATCCRSGRLATLQVCERTLPDSGSGLSDWWQRHGSDDDSWAATTYRDLIARAGPAGERHATTISIALDLATAARQIRAAGGGLRGAAAVLRQEMTTLTAALRAADLTPTGWLDPGQVAVILRSAYDPAVAAALDRHGHLGHDLATAGPVAVTETWDRLHSDTGHHAVLWISEWPRTAVYPGFLAPLLLTSNTRRTLSLLYTPVRVDQAARDLRRRRTEHLSDAAHRARLGQIDDPAHTAEYHDILQQEAELTAGHGILRYTGLIAITATTPDQLDTAIADIEQAAIQASCETRLLSGQQAQAFTAAALPLCRSS